MKTLHAAFLAAVTSGIVLLVAVSPAMAGSTKPASLVSPPLSINPNEAQPMCLVGNLSDVTPVTATIEIIDGTGTPMVASTVEVLPGKIEAVSDLVRNFWTYCRVTLPDATQKPLIRASHCSAQNNSVRACVEAH